MRRSLKIFLSISMISTVLILILIAYDLKLKSEEPAMQAAIDQSLQKEKQDCIKMKNLPPINITQYNDACGNLTGFLTK